MKTGPGHFMLFIAIAFSGQVLAQSFPIGHTSATYIDPSRNDRQIPTEIYYPGQTEGENVPIAAGVFPVLSFGHGFVMTLDAYLNFSNLLVPQGYILMLPNTETSFSPSHADLGLDLAFLISAMQDDGNDPGSLFYGAVADESAVMGHSMGGGASFLAAAAETGITAIANFAAAITSPSSVTAAASTEIPALMFSGSADCVTPPSQHQQPMYDSLASDCKTLVSVTGGGHCYFADYNLLCTFGENSCSPNLTITREQQQDATFDLLIPWLAFTLKGDAAAWEEFNDSLQSSSRITYQQDCQLSGMVTCDDMGTRFSIYPVPCGDEMTIECDIIPGLIEIYDFSGRRMMTESRPGKLNRINTANLEPGIYLLKMSGPGSNQQIIKFVKAAQ